MSEKYQTYSEYKDSEEVWIGKIPLHWEIASLSKLFGIQAGGDVKTEFFSEIHTEEHPYPIYTNANDEKAVYGYTSKCNYAPDTITVSGRGEVGFAVFRDHAYDAIIRLLVLTPIGKHHGKFFVYFINAVIDFRVESSAIGQLSTQQISPYKVAFPSFMEQQKIANFLDHETAKIDTLIEKQQLLIKLLKEKRQAVISHSVTKGLNPNVPMRDSGVEWLGEVPEHWNVSKFNYEIDFLEGPGILAYDFFEEGVPLLRIQNVKEEYVTDNYKTYLSPSKVLSKWDHFRVELGDLIISCSASTGLVSEVDSRCVGAIPYTGLIRLRPLSARICKDFIAYMVQSDIFFEQINILQTGSTMQHFGPYHLQQMYITLPPLDEQENVVTHIKHCVADIDRLVEKAEQAVALMNERRTALISAAVTGKIDVRNWKAPEPNNNNKEVAA